MRTFVSLTAEQESVVNHNHGPALVFAVAGAGKTTAMVHRIERLVREKVFAPQQILATSFGSETVGDLGRALHQWPHCQPVRTRTLHALGRDIIQRAHQLGHAPDPSAEAQTHTLPQRLLNTTLSQARHANVSYKRELDGLDRTDFLDYIGSCKSQLAFADLGRVQLPPAAHAKATQAEPPSRALNYYLDLYQIFEEIRQQQGAITFDDMLLTGWQLLINHPDLLDQIQQQYQCVLIDEFQDINLAQSELLDLITQPHRNLMAIGDDDQTIYEWRGANPRFILNFAARYDAQTYLISNNFRCPAAPLVLANHTIAHNKQRSPKQLRLTRGLDGDTQIRFARDIGTLADHLVEKIDDLHTHDGRALNDIAVLVRLNAQTPHIEQALIKADIPYRISKPFYARSEIETLIRYCRLAWMDAQISAETLNLTSPAIREQLTADWRAICNRPKRYINGKLREDLISAVIRNQQPLHQTLAQWAQLQDSWLTDKLQQLADDLKWLSGRLNQPAESVLRELEARLGYKAFLRQSSGLPQTGEGRAVGVDVFISYAARQGSLLDFMRHIKQLRDQKIGRDTTSHAVTISTIHQAKGREWPIVFIPQVNQDIFPFNSSSGGAETNLEEERRLFYVALTRTREQLHIAVTEDAPPSPFLAELRWRDTLKTLDAARDTLAKPPDDWHTRDALALSHAISAYGFESYFRDWWPVDQAAAKRMAQVLAAVVRAGHTGALKVSSADLSLWESLAPELLSAESTFTGRLNAVLQAGHQDQAILTNALNDPSPSIRYLAETKLSQLTDAGVGKKKRQSR